MPVAIQNRRAGLDVSICSMSDGFAIHTGNLRESGGQLQHLGEQFGGRQGGLNAQIIGSSAIWGADDEGAAFGEAYQELTAKVQELLGAMAEAFDTVGFNLGVVADNIDAADESVREQLAAIMDQLGRRP